MLRGLTASSETQRRNQAGFTLVEILGVLVIVGLMSSAVILTMPSAKPAVIVQSDQLVMELNNAAQTSVLSGQMSAFGASEDSYAIYSLQDGQWAIELETPWPDEVSAALELEGVVAKLNDTLAPIVFFEPVGLSTPFKLTLRGDNESKTLLSLGDGRVILDGP